MSTLDPFALRERVLARGGAVSVDELRALRAYGPSGAVGCVLEVIDPERILVSSDEDPDEGRLLLIVLCERQASWLAAMSHTFTQAFAVSALRTEGSDPFAVTRSTVVAEVAMATGLSKDSADARLGTAVLLSPNGLLAETHAALSRGLLTPWVARAVADATWELTPEQIREVQSKVLPRLIKPVDAVTGEGTPKCLKAARDAIARVVARVAPERAKRKREQAHMERGVTFRAFPESGLARITTYLPIQEASVLWETLQDLAYAEQSRDKNVSDVTTSSRTLSQCRADLMARAVAGLAAHVAATGELPAVTRPRVRVGLLIDLPTLLALRNGASEIPGYGPIDPELARILASDADWQRFIHEPTSAELLDLGHVAYTPSSRLREFIRARDLRCTFPGCSTPAHRAQLDHIIPWPEGPTDRSNLHPACVHHHNLKTHGKWQVTRDPATGEVRWRSPHGVSGVTPNRYSEFTDPPPD